MCFVHAMQFYTEFIVGKFRTLEENLWARLEQPLDLESGEGGVLNFLRFSGERQKIYAFLLDKKNLRGKIWHFRTFWPIM